MLAQIILAAIMSFYPSLQALIGANTFQSSGAVAAAIDWTRNNVFIAGSSKIASVGLLSGVEQAHAANTDFLYPAAPITNNGMNGVAPLITDTDGNIYFTWFSLNGGGLIKANGTNFAQISSGGADGLPPAGFDLANGVMANVPFGGAQYIAAAGGPIAQYSVIFNQVTYDAPYFNDGSTFLFATAGKVGTNISYWIAGPANFADPQHANFFSITITPFPSKSAVTTINPTDIDAGWVEIYAVGIAVDQTDGQPIVLFNGQPGAGNKGAIVKFNGTTGAIIWNTTLSFTPGQLIGSIFNQSIIQNQKLYLAHGNGFPTTVTSIDTNAGTILSNSTVGFSGVTIGETQCSNDVLDCVVLSQSYHHQAGNSPTQLNATPNNFDGWAVLYVASPPTTAASDGASSGANRAMRHIRSSAPYLQAMAQIQSMGEITGETMSQAEAERWCQ